MRIGIIGTRGIPNNYGGFEQLAEYLSVFLVEKNHEVFVYNSSLHPYQNKQYKGVNIIHCNDAESKMGAAGQFVYDLNCILDSRKRSFDVLLQLGYTSNSIWHFLLPAQTKIITNMDGFEWKRSKYNNMVQLFLKQAERWAVKSSPYLIADSVAIKSYLQKKYNRQATHIAYGATPFNLALANNNILKTYQLQPQQYYLAIARFEPENNLETIIKGVLAANGNTPLLLIGNYNNTYGNYLRKTYAHPKIIFAGGIYQIDVLNNLRYFCAAYFHGHTVGGTNPSLLEAMAASAYIIAHNNDFNMAILKTNASYFSNSAQICMLLNNSISNKSNCIANNVQEIAENYSWQKIVNQYERLMLDAINN